MKPDDYFAELDDQLALLTAFARQVNELDLAGALAEEFRGEQADGWSTATTAHQVRDELLAIALRSPFSWEDRRLMLALYAQLAEAGGVYESLRNMFGVLEAKPWLTTPFRHLVRVRSNRVIGPNANATFKDFAAAAAEIGMTRLSELLEFAFRDDLRNGVAHADYILWSDGVRLPMRNGGYPKCVPHREVFEAIDRGLVLFDLLKAHRDDVRNSFRPAREIVGRLSVNPPMRYRVDWNPRIGLSFSSNSGGTETSPEFERQTRINEMLAGRVFALFAVVAADADRVAEYMQGRGFEPSVAVLPQAGFEAAVAAATQHGLWDRRIHVGTPTPVLLVSPWGTAWADIGERFDQLLAGLRGTHVRTEVQGAGFGGGHIALWSWIFDAFRAQLGLPPRFPRRT